MDDKAVQRLNARRRILAALGFVLTAVAAVLIYQMHGASDRIETFKQSKALHLTEFSDPIVAMELPRSEEDVRLVIGDRPSADAARMAAIQRTDYWFIAVYSLLLAALAILGGSRASFKRRRLFILALLTVGAAAFSDARENRAILALLGQTGTVDSIRHAALTKWTAVYVTAGLIGLLFMTSHFRASERPRWVIKFGGLLLFFGALFGLGVWLHLPFASLGLPFVAAAIPVLLFVGLAWPAMLDDPERPPASRPSSLEVSKADHMLPLAQAALKEIEEEAKQHPDRKSELARQFGGWLEDYATKVGQQSSDIPCAVQWELMADFLVRERPDDLARLATGEFCPSVIRDIAHETLHEPHDEARRKSIESTLSAFGAGDLTQPENVLFAQLLVWPSLAVRLAEQMGIAIPFALAQQAELDEIRISRGLRASEGDVAAVPPDRVEATFWERLCASPGRLAPRYAPRQAFDLNLMGLAFSGGGIRSATFNLGVLQGLADLRLLPRIDYLSTVSGGGYIGSWFVSWAKRLGGVKLVQERLSPRRSPDPNAPATRPIRFLREYSSYLTPQAGLLGADSWTLAGIWLRNTLLVQAVLVFFLAAALLLPLNLGILARVSEQWSMAARWMTGTLGLGCFFVVCLRMGTELARFVNADATRVGLDASWAPRSSAGLQQVQWTIVIPGFLCTLLLGVCLWSWGWERAALPAWLGVTGADHLFKVGMFAFSVFAVGLLVVEVRAGYARSLMRVAGARRRAISLLVILLATVGPAVVAAGMTMGVLALYGRWDKDYASWHVVALGPPLMAAIVGGLLIQHVGLLGRTFDDDRREWLSRLTAWLFIWCAGWLALFGFAIYSPWAVGSLGRRLAAAGGLAWVVSTAWGAYLGQSGSNKKSSGDASGQAAVAKDSRGWKDVVALIAPYVFVVGLLVVISLGLHALIAAMYETDLVTVLREEVYWAYLGQIEGRTAFLLMAGLVLAALLLAWRVDVNEFSMHHLYKNRLVRCYLGASREGSSSPRHPHPFTGFDRDDDLALATFRTDPGLGCGAPPETAEPVRKEAAPPYLGPLPVICTALNLVKGDDLAWQERKAQSFVFTPLFSGFEHVPSRRRAFTKASVLRDDGLRPTGSYAYPTGGVRLGTAMAISGAAANPNMGYHSSPATGFLLTMFNVRLGWWMGNPRHDKTWRQSSPTLGLSCLINELTGNTTNHSGFVNLSDGGHFENLGVYELVRRRCRFIVACDAEQDGGFTFGGLGSMVRKCRTDFGVHIVFPCRDVFEISVDRYKKVHAAVGDIQYPGGEHGRLLYVKSSLAEDQASDVLEYSRRVKEFPHESTADQWFDESQFESYRQLGQHIIRGVMEKAAHGLEADADCWGKIFERLAAIAPSVAVASPAPTPTLSKAPLATTLPDVAPVLGAETGQPPRPSTP